jgi:hypothetical protein
MTDTKKKKKPKIRKAPFIIILIFLIIGTIGVATGETGRVLEQAVQVCLSCIGIG